MHPTLMDLGLRRAGFPNLERYMEVCGLKTEEEAAESLMPYILGYTLWRIHAGDTYTKIAREKGVSVRAIAVANPQYTPERLPVGAYLVVPCPFPVVPEDTPVSWQLTHYILRGLQARYPFLRMDVIGRSAGRRPLERICLGTGPRRVFYNASHHANEWITTLVVLQCLEQYARAVAFGEELLGQDAGQLSRETSLYLVPLVNPDGVDLLSGMVTPQEEAAARAIAENYPDIPFPEGWKANLRGVDLNLNYPALWDRAREIKYEQGYTTPAPRDFVGEEPLSEAESRAMFDTTEALDPELTIAWHTQGREIYWKFQDMEPAGSRNLGLQMAAASGYELEDVPYASGFAGYKDWFIQEFSRPGYTVEAGEGDNPLPLDQLPELLKDNLPIFLLGLTGGDPDFREAPSEPPERQEMRPTMRQNAANQGWG